jgi:Peptidase_C39 like family
MPGSMTLRLLPSGVPYYSQWESPELVPRFLDGSLPPAADPRWAASGARTPAEYGFWSPRVCGLACLRMILASRGKPVPPMMALVQRALRWRAYIPDGDRVIGLIYRPFADWVSAEFGVAAEVTTGLTVEGITAAAGPDTPVIASVHHWIRWPERTPPTTGGHLVLVTGSGSGLLRFHNPSGIPGSTQRDAVVTAAEFSSFFSGRGLLVAA